MSVGLLSTVPAHAAIPTDGTTVDPVTKAVTQVQSVEDDGGVKYTISVTWVKKYYDPAGTLRVSVPSLIVYRDDADVVAAGEPEDAGLDIHFDVRNHGTTIIQHKNLDNVDLDYASDNRASFNPRNPRSDVGDTDIRVRVGTDGDGLGASDWVYFVQPEGLPAPA